MKSNISNVVQIAVLATLIIGGFFFFTQKDIQAKIFEPKIEKPEQTQVTSAGTSDQLTVNDVVQLQKCDTISCFENKFSKCESGEFTSEEAFGSIAFYKIIDQTYSGCSVLFKYLKNPNPDWVNKEMTCNFDNALAFGLSVESTIEGVISGTKECDGPFYGVLSTMNQQVEKLSTVSVPSGIKWEVPATAVESNMQPLIPIAGTYRLDGGPDQELKFFDTKQIPDVQVYAVVKSGNDIIINGSGFLSLNRGPEIENSKSCSSYNSGGLSQSTSDTEIVMRNYVKCLPEGTSKNYVSIGLYDWKLKLAEQEKYKVIYKNLGGFGELKIVSIYNKYLIN